VNRNALSEGETVKLPAQRAGLLKNLKNYCFRLIVAAIHPHAKQGAFLAGLVMGKE